MTATHRPAPAQPRPAPRPARPVPRPARTPRGTPMIRQAPRGGAIAASRTPTPMSHRLLRLLGLLLPLAACDDGHGPGAAETADTLVVTVGIRGADSTMDYVVTTTQPRLITQVRDEMAQPPHRRSIINGEIRRAIPGENLQWHWAIVPNRWGRMGGVDAFCDGLPTDPEQQLARWVDTVRHFCPTGSYVKDTVWRGILTATPRTR